MPRAVDAMLGRVSGERMEGWEKRTSARMLDVHEDDERVEHYAGFAP
jgi:ribosomal protein S10